MIAPGGVPDRLRHAWEQVRASVLFVPGALVLLAAFLAFFFLHLDNTFEREVVEALPWLFSGGPDGARQVLATIAGSMVTLAGVTFSILTVALSLASQQFGPRLLRNFTTDLVNQVMLGAFIATFAYCLLVLREVRGFEDETFVPLIAVTFGVMAALATLGLFVYFIHHVIDSIQASTVIAGSAREAMQAIDTIFPESVGEPVSHGEGGAELPPLADAELVDAGRSGYVQAVNTEKLLETARRSDLVLRMEIPVGSFVAQGTPLVTASPAKRVTDEVRERILSAFAIGRHRSMHQDPEFGVRQIVDIAVKALSPSENDPTTAVYCIDYLAAVLVHLVTREIPSDLRLDRDGNLRLVTRSSTFEGIAGLAFDQIRQYAKNDVAATFRLLEMIGKVGAEARTDAQREVLERHLRKVARGAEEGIEDPADRIAFNDRLAEACDLVGCVGTAERYRLSPRGE